MHHKRHNILTNGTSTHVFFMIFIYFYFKSLKQPRVVDILSFVHLHVPQKSAFLRYCVSFIFPNKILILILY